MPTQNDYKIVSEWINTLRNDPMANNVMEGPDEYGLILGLACLHNFDNETVKSTIENIEKDDDADLITLDANSVFLCEVSMPEIGPGIPWSEKYHLHKLNEFSVYILTVIDDYPDDDLLLKVKATAVLDDHGEENLEQSCIELLEERWSSMPFEIRESWKKEILQSGIIKEL